MKELRKSWDSFCLFKKWISRLFHHHNKKIAFSKTPEGKNEHTDYIGVNEYQSNVYVEFKRRILESIQVLWSNTRLNKDRESNLPLLSAVFNLMDEILEPHSVERKDFFERVNESTCSSSLEFYKSKLEEWNTEDCGSYFDWLYSFSQEEEEILNRITPNCEELAHISKALRNIFYQVLLTSYKQTLSKSTFGLSHLISSKNYAVRSNNELGAAEDKETLYVLQR